MTGYQRVLSLLGVAALGLGSVWMLRETHPASPNHSPFASNAPTSVDRALDPERSESLTVSYRGLLLHPGRRRDEIAPIHEPFLAPPAADPAPLADDDWLIGVHYHGVARAYPLWILSTREIVNDRIGADAICVTYCPLSASAVVFAPRVRGRDLDFGNHGALYECNLVLYDRQTGSLWYQLRGEAIVGPLAGETLPVLPASLCRWADWKRIHPKTALLVGDRRAGRFFRVTEFGHPKRIDIHAPLAAPVSRIDSRLPLRQEVFGFRWGAADFCLVRYSAAPIALGRHPLSGTDGLSLWASPNGDLQLMSPAGEPVPLIPSYWFAWHAAYPSGKVLPDPRNVAQ